MRRRGFDGGHGSAYAVALGGVAFAIVISTRRRVRQAMRLKLAEQQKRLAEEANAAKTDFMATLGHEIRTPMTGVLGMAELMARTPLDDTQRSYVEAVRRSGATLLRLVNDALDITRIESRRLVLESECVSLRAIGDEVVALATGGAGEKGLVLSSAIDAGVPEAIRGDAIRLRQILQNLVNNAVKFTERGGVSLHMARDGGTLVMTVNDTGPGMSAALCSASVFPVRAGRVTAARPGMRAGPCDLPRALPPDGRHHPCEQRARAGQFLRRATAVRGVYVRGARWQPRPLVRLHRETAAPGRGRRPRQRGDRRLAGPARPCGHGGRRRACRHDGTLARQSSTRCCSTWTCR